jgi:hypothetical protein
MSTIQAYTTATRPSAVGNPGLTIFNTTDKSINVSDGANWRGYQYDQAAISPISNSYNASFDGQDDIVNVGDLSSLLSSTTNSFSWWFKYNDITQDLQHMFGADDNESGVTFDPTKRGFLCIGRPTVAGGEKIDFTYYGSSSDLVSGFFTHTPDTNWHHIVVTFDASANTLDAYFDGVNQNITPTVTGTVSTFQRPTTDYTVGARKSSSPNRFFDGRIDEVAFWDVELDSANAIQLYNSLGGEKPFDISSNAEDYNQAANLQGWWRFENNGNDETGNSSAAAVSGATYVSNTL